MSEDKKVRVTVQCSRNGIPVYGITKLVGAPFIWAENTLGADCKFRVGDYLTEAMAEEVAEKHELTVIPKA